MRQTDRHTETTVIIASSKIIVIITIVSDPVATGWLQTICVINLFMCERKVINFILVSSFSSVLSSSSTGPFHKCPFGIFFVHER